jgi:hypothetical protein
VGVALTVEINKKIPGHQLVGVPGHPMFGCWTALLGVPLAWDTSGLVPSLGKRLAVIDFAALHNIFDF